VPPKCIALCCIDHANHRNFAADDDAFGEFLSGVSDPTLTQQSTLLSQSTVSSVEASSSIEDGRLAPDDCDSIRLAPVMNKQAGVKTALAEIS